jgi:5-methylcytosine-specific restriction protein A
MPTVPSNTRCSSLGCNNPKTRFSSSCVEHGGKERIDFNASAKRKEFNSAYSTKQWKTFRQAQLSREPLCASCLIHGVITTATEVDHVFPWSKLHKASFSYNIFQSLCKSCHIMKTTLEQKDVIKYYKDKEHTYTIQDYAYVMHQHTSIHPL